ncbi:MAG: dimethylmenaquinone methyltransferase [Desulfovibrio sp.]|nr:dimethylmenaquinone methyltransferase [Desulfovibrio sp.]
MRYSIHPPATPIPPAIANTFADLAVADICDALGRNAALPSALRPICPERLLGTAYTVHLPASENLLLYYAADNARPGDVLVVACGGYTERAVTGEIMINYARKRGLAGIVVDGAVRDVAALRTLHFPVYARAVSPNGPYKSACGEVNVPVSIGQVVISPGDLIVGDEDGIVAIRRNEAADVAAKAREIAAAGHNKLQRILQEGVTDYSWLYQRLQDSGCVIHTTPSQDS